MPVLGNTVYIQLELGMSYRATMRIWEFIVHRRNYLFDGRIGRKIVGGWDEKRHKVPNFSWKWASDTMDHLG